MKHRSMPSFYTLFTLFALLLALTACGKAIPSEPGGQTGPETIPIPEEQGQETASPRELTCLADAAPVVLAAPGGAGRALVLCADYQANGGQLTLKLVDLRDDRVLASLDMEGDFWSPLGCRNNGELLFTNPDRGILLRCDETLSTLGTLPLPGEQAVFSRDEDCVYAYTPQCLTQLRLSGETRELLRLRNGGTIEDVEPDARLILISGPAANEQADTLYGVYDFDGKQLWTQETTAMAVGFTEGLLLTQDYNAPAGVEGEKVLAAYNSRDNWAQSAYACDRDERILCRADTPWLIALRDTGGDGESIRTPTHLGLIRAATGERLAVCELEGSPDLYPVPTGEGDSLLICAVKEGKNRLLVVEPKLLTVSERLQTVAYHPEPDSLPAPEYPSYLAELRTMADRMEADYGVTIHFGDAVLGWTDGDFPIVTPSGAYKDHEISMLQKALDCLDRTLAAYPDDFTAHFRNFKGEGGLRFLLATEFRSETESFLPSGTMYPSGGWYNINLTLVDCTEQVIHHEIWHAVDCYLSGTGSAVDEDMWNGMNPAGFAYGNDRNSYQDDESAAAFALGSADPADACITRAYSSVNEQEDRATLIEYILRPDAPGSAAENFTDCPILKAKLDYLTELTRPVFGYVYWEEILKQR